METIKVLIVEDQGLIAESIAKQLADHEMQVVAICDSGEDAIAQAEEKRPDLILMDIELKGAIDGIAAAKIIQDKSPTPIIYLSDYTDGKTVGRAKMTMPANYLSKPFNEQELIRAIEIAVHNANAKNQNGQRAVSSDYVFLRLDNQVFKKLAYKEILYLEAGRSYCNIVTDSDKHILSRNMKDINEQLNHEDFMRVHRSFVVNINRIDQLEGNTIKISNHEVQIGPEFRDNLMKRLKFVK